LKKVLLLKAGEAANPVRLRVGDYERWFQRALGGEAKLEVLRVSQGANPPRTLDGYDALMMTGSPLSVASPTDWMIRSAEFLKKAGDRRLPVLGVCFGHQLLGFAYGSQVILNPQGREIGSIQVELTPEGRTDPLFANLPNVFWVQTTHEDIVSTLPNGARHLALNQQTTFQSFGIGSNVRGVQFHPEMEPEMMTALVRARAQILEREASRRGRAEGEWIRELVSGIRPTRAGKRILLNFLRNFD
jgi:GMP synthase (glutamine-hydrolysing)